MSVRQEKVNELLKVEISEIIQRELRDPRLGFVTVTGVETSPDLRHAKVFISIFGKEEEQQAGLKTLRKAAGFVRTEIGKRVRMRTTPEIDFRIDESIAEGVKMFEILQKIKQDESEEK